MPRANRRTAVLETLILSSILAVLPACSASAGSHRASRPCPPRSAPSGNIVYRPAYPGLRSRPLYISGYAGVVYPPLGSRAPLQPTTGRRPFSGWFAGHAAQP
jgi:hypothetical protein